MTGFTLRDRLSKGDRIFAAWISSAHPRVAEAVMQAGFDAALFDLQHGEADFGEVRDGIAAVRRLDKPSAVRGALDGYGEAARALDVGAELAIMPMVNSPDDARRLVETLKYPPVGGRSWGATRAIDLLGLATEVYRTTANDNVVVLAMIETRAAVEALDDILDVPGLDGVFVGPRDLSISLSDGAHLDDQLPESVAVIARLLEAAKARGKVTAIYCGGGAEARRNAALGFDILGVGGDMAFLSAGARAALAAARGDAEKGAPSY